MFDRLREIDEELAELPEQLEPLEQQVKRGREIVAQSEQNNPMRQTLPTLLKTTERNHVENLGWLVNEQSTDAAAVAVHVAKFMLTALGKPFSGGEVTPYETSLAEFVRVEGGAGLPPSVLEGALLRKLFGEPWLAADSKVRAHIMENLKRDTEENARWLPEPKAQILDEEGRSVVGEGAGAYGGYFTSSAVVSMGLRMYRLQPPTRGFAGIGNTLALLVDDNHYKKFSGPLTAAATTSERGRALIVLAYVHFIRSIQMGTFEREHRKIMDALGAAEVALETGKKRIERLRTTRSEIVMQSAGIIGIAMTILAILIFVIYSTLTGEDPPKKLH
jgi:hypothetical protein